MGRRRLLTGDERHRPFELPVDDREIVHGRLVIVGGRSDVPIWARAEHTQSDTTPTISRPLEDFTPRLPFF